MAAAHVQHVVGHVGAGDVVGDHLHADGAAGAGSLVDVLARVMSVVGVTESVAETWLADRCTRTVCVAARNGERDVEDGVGAGGDSEWFA